MTDARHLLVVFGASGDLAARKIGPALAALQERRLLPAPFGVLGLGRTPLDDAAFRSRFAAGTAALDRVPLRYVPMDPADPAAFAGLRDRLTAWSRELGTGGNLLFYLAVPPDLHGPILRGLAAAGLNRPPAESPGAWRRVIVEKPFGRDLASAKALNRQLHAAFREAQIFRIDHYLGKETVQNILAARFANSLFEPLWNRNGIARIEITAAESLGVETRGGYYDRTGALRDMVQNHLLQVLAFLAMEPPASAAPEALRRETRKVFRALRLPAPEALAQTVVRGQYTASRIRGRRVAGYRDEPGVAPGSRTETFVALRVDVARPRWAGVPFFIRTGKRLPTRVSEAVIHFKPPVRRLFQGEAGGAVPANQLILRIQPDEGMLLRFNLKTPGAGLRAQPAGMDFHYRDLGHLRLPDAYERLLVDAMLGDSTLFLRGDESEAAWAFIDPLLAAWDSTAADTLYGYPAGTWGPAAADALLGASGETWRYPCKNLTADDAFCEL